MRRRRFTLALTGFATAAGLTGALVVAAAGTDSDHQGIDKTATSAEGAAVQRNLINYRDFYLARPGGRSLWDSYATSPAGRVGRHCITTADAAEHWMRETGHLPCEP